MHTSTHTHLENVRLLHASRRLDWRFLLPDPSLGIVGYLGPSRGSLLDALRLFSTSTDVLSGAQALADHPAAYDLIVINDASARALDAARRALKPGGSLYAEFGRVPVTRLSTTLRSASALVGLAQASGLIDVRAHWHWPSFEGCTRIVPVDDGDAFAFVLTHGRAGAGAHVKGATARLLARSGLLGWTVPCLSIVGQAPGQR
ncbi:MAG: hypothetical protein ABL986_20260 [Vicinamibacterales bacterium]